MYFFFFSFWDVVVVWGVIVVQIVLLYFFIRSLVQINEWDDCGVEVGFCVGKELYVEL